MVNADLPDKERFVVLDGMRGLAALVVIMDHVYSPLLTQLFPGRYLAVDFFFALSGFVLSHVYAQRLQSGMSTFAFMRVRLIRLYPLYIVGSLLGAALALVAALKGWNPFPAANAGWALLFGAFFLPCPPGLATEYGSIFPLDGPSWSLFFELVANFVFTLLILRLTRGVLAVILAVSAALLAVAAFHFGKADLGWSWENFAGGFPRVMYGFFAGVVVYRLRKVWRAPTLPPLAAFAVLLVLFMVPTPAVWRWVYDLAAALVLFPLLVAVSAEARPRGALLQISAVVGTLSYGIYVLHVPIRNWIEAAMPILMPSWEALPGLTHYGVVAVAAVIAAAVLHVVYDTPVRRWLSRRRSREARA